MLIIVPELLLRVVDFKYVSRIEFGSPRTAIFESLVPDERLFWRLPSHLPGVNSLGFHGDEIVTPKPDGTCRVLYLGDSCTDYGFPRGYPALTESLLNADHRLDFEVHFESVVLALGGYTSHQGQALADMYGEQLEPNLAVVFFGWNDHWLARGAIDAEKAIRISKWSNTYNRLSKQSRLLQALIRFSVIWTYGNAEALLEEVRVPIGSYEENLLNIAAIFHRLRTPVVFLTAPTSHYVIGVPDYLIDLGYTRDKKTVLALHQSYNQVVRKVAEETESFLLDLESTFNSQRDIGRYFISDGIHSTGPGLELIARQLKALMVEHILPRNVCRARESPAAAA
jgi:lysophospholipase L1-like esterase